MESSPIAVARSRIEGAMIDVAIAPCWFPSPLRPLIGSAGTSSLKIMTMVLDDYSTEEINAALAEHKRWSRVSVVTFSQADDVLIHATPTLYAWLEPQPKTLPAIRVASDLEYAIVEGKRVQLPSKRLALFLASITGKRGGWISTKEIQSFDPELYGARCDRLKRQLPPEIKPFIVSKPGTGYRLA